MKLSQERISSLIEQSPMAVALLHGRDLIFETANSSMLRILGKDCRIIGRPILEAIPELKDQTFLHLQRRVFESGIPYFAQNTLAMLEHNGVMQEQYFDFTYSPVRNEEDEVTGIMALAVEVTEQVRSRKAIEESESRYRTLIAEAPVATSVYTGPELVIEMANDTMLSYWGKDKNVINLPLEEALPELKGQPFIDILNNVYQTGITHHEQDARAEIKVDGVLATFYFTYTYKPIRNQKGEIYAILNMAVDVTQQVVARKKIEEAEESLLLAVELAQLGTWHIDLNTRILQYSKRLRDWFGFDEDEVITPEKAYDSVANPEDRELIRNSMLRAIDPAVRSLYDVEYTVLDKVHGVARIIHVQGKASFNDQEQAFKVTGNARDVTEQRKIELSLQRQVQKRTEELQEVNEALKFTNEELFKLNDQLVNSNEELAQFAYVASHDLQEPLRKIRTFSSMLQKLHQMSADSLRPINKIIESADRMSMLINDLLEFSRLLKSDTLKRPINLAEVCKAVINDFELSIAEKSAEIVIGPLPVIEAVGLQMNQLFYNLLGNALKFSHASRTPTIEISSTVLTMEEVEKYILRPDVDSTYHQITFADNGIGFDVKYSEQIFEVFKRLHGRDLYPGSGIGLALCRRIVTNHNGYLYAESIQGRGATFHILLPEKTISSEEVEPVS